MSDVLHFLNRRWWALLAIPVIAGIATYAIASSRAPVYRATATLLVGKTSESGDAAGRLTNTYAQLVKRPVILDEVAKRLGLGNDRGAIAGRLDVSPAAGTQLIRITASDRTAEAAAKLANTTAAAFGDDNASQPSPAASVSIARQAVAPLHKSSPNVLRDVVLAVALGLVAAAGLKLLAGCFDDAVDSPEKLAAATGATVLASIDGFEPDEGSIVADLPPGVAEAFRKLRTNVLFSEVGGASKTIVVTSAGAEEGKSTTAYNLAAMLAQAGSRVILVDADLRRAALSEALKAPASFGLAGLLQSAIQNPSLAFISTRWRNLQLLPAGPLPANPSELLSSARMVGVIEALRGRGDYVIFDTPSVLAVTDASAIGARTDGIILVAEAGRTRSDSLRRATQALANANAKLIGSVLNRTQSDAAPDYAPANPEAIEIEAAGARPRSLAGLTASGGSAYPTFPTATEPVASVPTTPLSVAINEILAHMDDTAALIKSTKTESNGRSADL